MKVSYVLILFLFVLTKPAMAQRVIGSTSSSANLDSGVKSISFGELILIASSFPVGTVLSTGYFKTQGDLGGSEYLVTTDTVAGYAVDSVAVTYISGGKYLKLIPSKDGINGNSFDLDETGVTDNSAKIKNAIRYASLLGCNVFFSGYGVNRFRTTGLVYVSEDSIKIQGFNSFTIWFNHRSHHAFEFNESNYTEFSGFNFIGARDSVLAGALTCMFINNSKKFRAKNIRSTYAALFLGQNRTQDTINTVYIQDCYAKNSFTPAIPGSGYTITGCTWEQTDSSYLDRSLDGGYGSSHALYGYSDRRNIVITHNMFTNIRLDGVKFSGSSGHVNNVVISHNVFSRCGTAITIGGDKSGDHPHIGFVISNNIFRDCFGQRLGWTSTECTIRMYAVDNIVIRDNLFSYRSTNPTYWIYTIRGNSSGKIYMSNLTIEGNQFYGVDVDNNPTNADVIGKPIYLVNWNQYSPGKLIIRNNTFENEFQLQVNSSANVFIENNKFTSDVDMLITGCANVIVRDNVHAYTSNKNLDRQAVYNDCAWVHETGNISIANTNRTGVWRQEINGVRGVRNSIGMASGIAFPTYGKPMTGFFYGSGWDSGDSIKVGATTLKFGIDFDNSDTLISKIKLISGFTAYDIADSTGIDGATKFIVVQKTTPQANPISYEVQIFSAAYTAGVGAFGGMDTSQVNQYGYAKAFRLLGGGADKMVIFSPIANQQADYIFTPINAQARAIGTPTYQLGQTTNSAYFGTIELTLPSTPVGGERFAYRVIN